MEMQASGRLGILWLQQCHDDQWAVEVAGLYSSGAGTCACHLTFDKSVSRDCWSSSSGAIFWIRSFKWYKNWSIWKIPNGGGGFWVLGFAPDRQPPGGQQGLFRIRVPSGHLCQWGSWGSPQRPFQRQKALLGLLSSSSSIGAGAEEKDLSKVLFRQTAIWKLRKKRGYKVWFPKKTQNKYLSLNMKRKATCFLMTWLLLQPLEVSQPFIFWDLVAFLWVWWHWAACSPLCGVCCMEKLPPLVVELLSGPKHTCPPVLLAVFLTWILKIPVVAWEVLHFAEVLTSLSHKQKWVVCACILAQTAYASFPFYIFFIFAILLVNWFCWASLWSVIVPSSHLVGGNGAGTALVTNMFP